jgi:hypothetical protein
VVYPAWCEDDFTTPLDDDNTNTPFTSIRSVSPSWQSETLQWQLRTLVIRKSPANNPMHRSRERETLQSRSLVAIRSPRHRRLCSFTQTSYTRSELGFNTNLEDGLLPRTYTMKRKWGACGIGNGPAYLRLHFQTAPNRRQHTQHKIATSCAIIYDRKAQLCPSLAQGVSASAAELNEVTSRKLRNGIIKKPIPPSKHSMITRSKDKERFRRAEKFI